MDQCDVTSQKTTHSTFAIFVVDSNSPLLFSVCSDSLKQHHSKSLLAVKSGQPSKNLHMMRFFAATCCLAPLVTLVVVTMCLPQSSSGLPDDVSTRTRHPKIYFHKHLPHGCLGINSRDRYKDKELKLVERDSQLAEPHAGVLHARTIDGIPLPCGFLHGGAQSDLSSFTSTNPVFLFWNFGNVVLTTQVVALWRVNPRGRDFIELSAIALTSGFRHGWVPARDEQYYLRISGDAKFWMTWFFAFGMSGATCQVSLAVPAHWLIRLIRVLSDRIPDDSKTTRNTRTR